MITSKRTFGVELEMGQHGGQSDAMLETKHRKLLEKAKELGWNVGSDISIKDFALPVEARSPILCGEEGENNFREFTKYVNKLGFDVNDTCGTHVHFGGSDFVNRTHLKEVSLEEYVTNEIHQGYNPGIVFDVDAYKTIIENTEESFIAELIIQANNNEQFEIGVPIGNRLVSKIVCAQLYLPELGMNAKLVIKASKLRKLIGEDNEYDILTLGKEIDIEELIFMSRPIKDNYVKLQRLFMFYTVFDSVLFKMLPKSRQINNRFCKPLSTSYSFGKIRGTRNMGEIEKLWYGSNKLEEIVSMKQQNKHESRRHSVNLHSLLGGIGTIEVRMHHGSLDADELVNWIELHQFIIDQISKGNVSVAMIERAASVQDIDTKVSYMIESIALPKNLQDYIRKQIKK